MNSRTDYESMHTFTVSAARLFGCFGTLSGRTVRKVLQHRVGSGACWLMIAVLVMIGPGCGLSLPDVSAVRAQMTAEQIEVSDPVVNTVGMVLVPVPAGEFLMGTAAAKASKDGKSQQPPGAEAEMPQHKVRISRPFFISVCEVTQNQYALVTGDTPWKGKPLTKEGDNIAASYVTWQQAVDFCRQLSQLEDCVYRLPTEAEWEYTCRATSTSSFSFGDDQKQIGDCAWFDQNAYKDGEQYAHAVGQKHPNTWSLYDTHGNVWEWCSDFHGSYAEQLKSSKGKVLVDPIGPETGRQHVWRGGGFADNAVNLRSATRNSYGRVDYRPEFMAGFRVVRESEAAK